MQSATQKSQGRRAKIIEVATRQFAQSGFHGASTRRIAEDAEVAQSLLLYHFKTKDDLWRAVMDDCFRRAADARLNESNATPQEQLADFVLTFVTFCSLDADLHRLMTLAGRKNDDRLKWLVKRHLRPVFEQVRSWIELGQKEGWIRAGDPTLLYYSIIAIAGSTYSLAPEIELLAPETRALDVKEVEELITSILFIE